jgi:hypothetical protein
LDTIAALFVAGSATAVTVFPVQSIAPLATAGVFVAIPKPITKPDVPKIAKPRLRVGLIKDDGSFAEARA